MFLFKARDFHNPSLDLLLDNCGGGEESWGVSPLSPWEGGCLNSLYPHATPTAGSAWLRQLLPGRHREMHQVQGFSWSDLEATFISDGIDALLGKISFEIPCFHRQFTWSLPLYWSVCGITHREKGNPCPLCCACGWRPVCYSSPKGRLCIQSPPE